MFRTLYDAFLFTLNSSLLSSAVSKQHVGDMEFSEVMVGQKVVLSPDGTMIAAVDNKRRIVQVWSVHDPDWYCKIDESVAGIANTMWSPDSRHILTVSEFQLRVTIWSISNKSISYIKFPKYSTKGIVFSPDGKYLAVLEREQFKDFVSVYYAEAWELVKVFQLDTEDAVDLFWSPDSAYLLAVETSLDYGVFVYTPDGRKIAHYSAYSNVIGVKSTAYSPQCTFVAVGSYDERLRLLNTLTWQCVGELEHKALLKPKTGCAVYKERLASGYTDYKTLVPASSVQLSELSGVESKANKLQQQQQQQQQQSQGPSSSLVSVLESLGIAPLSSGAATDREREGKEPLTGRSTSAQGREPLSARGAPRAAAALAGTGALSSSSSSSASSSTVTVYSPTVFGLESLPYEVKQVVPEADKPDPVLGVGTVEWSCDDRYVATRNDNMGETVWIWDAHHLALAAIATTLAPVRMMKWDPRRPRLAFCCGNDKVYIWSPEGISVVPQLHKTFNVRLLQWTDDGAGLVLADRDSYCLCYFRT